MLKAKKLPIKMVNFGDEVGIRPAVILNQRYGRVQVLKLTSRMKEEGIFYARMNRYIIHGFCNTGQIYEVPVGRVGQFKRNCTKSEEKEIMENLNYCREHELLKTYDLCCSR